MLEMRSQCERCGAPLRQNAENAWICSFECTFCTECVEGALRGTCPNCRGKLVKRPRRNDLNRAS